jgi:hypothetical protein
MTTANGNALARGEIEALLPWHAAGTLSPRDAERVEAALARDDELAREYAIVRNELVATIHLNETLGAPSVRAMERLFAAIEAEEASAPKRRSLFNIGRWMTVQMAGFSPRTLLWSTVAAGMALLLQTGLLAAVYFGQAEVSSGYATASYVETGETASGTFALVRFVPGANAEEIATFLRAHRMSIVDGPHDGGLYKIRIADTNLRNDEVRLVVAQLQEDGNLVRLVVPTD